MKTIFKYQWLSFIASYMFTRLEMLLHQSEWYDTSSWTWIDLLDLWGTSIILILWFNIIRFNYILLIKKDYNKWNIIWSIVNTLIVIFLSLLV
jgi:hypothetical protein